MNGKMGTIVPVFILLQVVRPPDSWNRLVNRLCGVEGIASKIQVVSIDNFMIPFNQNCICRTMNDSMKVETIWIEKSKFFS